MTEFRPWGWEGKKKKIRGVRVVRPWEWGRKSEGYSDFRESELELSEGYSKKSLRWGMGREMRVWEC